MKRFFQSIRFQLTIVLVLFVILNTVFITSIVLSNVQKGFFDIETKRITIVANQLAERYDKMYFAESIARNYANLTPEQQNVLIKTFLKPAFEDYYNNFIKNFPELEFGYYIPALDSSIVFSNSSPQYRFDKKLSVVTNINTGNSNGYVFVDEPYSVILSPLDKIRGDINRIIVYSALIAILLVLIITSIFTMKIIKIRKGLKLLENNLDFRFQKSGGEIGDIASSINTMAEHLKKNVEEMQKTESLKSLGMFTVGVVHEVRNPLTSIKGFAQILQKKLQGKEEEKYIKPILSETERLSKVVDDLLRFGRPSQLERVNFNLNLFFDHIVEMGKQYASNTQIVFAKDCEDIVINGDEKKLEELFLNLIINGIQAMDGKGQLSIVARKDGESVVVEIMDTGLGMDDDEIKNLFVPFYTTKAEGTGLGLAIAYRVAAQHNGKIEVESKKGKGTTFRVILPRGVHNAT
jgi:signal transduction histidine kinase